MCIITLPKHFVKGNMMGNPVYFEGDVSCMYGKIKHVLVSTHPGGTDSAIYVDGEKSAYHFGLDGHIYKTVSDRYVSNLPIADFARVFLWETGKIECGKAPLFLCFLKFYVIILLLIDSM